MKTYITKSLVTLLFLAFAVLAYSGVLDDKGDAYSEQALTRALIAFGVARGLNGVISVAQGTEIAVQPAGIGINFTPGQILDPINDLIERFSWIMLASSAALGIQQTLLSLSSWPYFTYTVVGVFVLAALMVWWPKLYQSKAGQLFYKFAVLFVFARFAVSLIAITGEWVYDEFLATQYEAAKAQLESTTENISKINQATQEELNQQEEQSSLLDKAKRMYRSATQSININARIAQYRDAAVDASKHTVNLIVVFVFQTVVFPLLFLWLLYWLAKNLLKLSPSDWFRIDRR